MWCIFNCCFLTAEPDKIFLQIFSNNDKTKIMMIAKFAESVINWQGQCGYVLSWFLTDFNKVFKENWMSKLRTLTSTNNQSLHKVIATSPLCRIVHEPGEWYHAICHQLSFTRSIESIKTSLIRQHLLNSFVKSSKKFKGLGNNIIIVSIVVRQTNVHKSMFV